MKITKKKLQMQHIQADLRLLRIEQRLDELEERVAEALVMIYEHGEDELLPLPKPASKDAN